jgi:hypothetical protein
MANRRFMIFSASSSVRCLTCAKTLWTHRSANILAVVRGPYGCWIGSLVFLKILKVSRKPSSAEEKSSVVVLVPSGTDCYLLMPALMFLPAFVDMPRRWNGRVSNMFLSRDKWQCTLNDQGLVPILAILDNI